MDEGKSECNSPNPMSPVIESADHVRHGSGFSALLGDGSEEEDSYLRDQVMECLSRSIGLVQSTPTAKPSSLRPELKTTGSSDYFSAMFQASLNGGGFGGGAPMRKTGSSNTTSDTGLDDMNTSNTSSTVPSVISEMENDVEIMYFPAGATLVEEGERNAGLFFVIDGVLDVSIAPKQDAHSYNAAANRPKNMFGQHLSSLNLKAILPSPVATKLPSSKLPSVHCKRRNAILCSRSRLVGWQDIFRPSQDIHHL